MPQTENSCRHKSYTRELEPLQCEQDKKNLLFLFYLEYSLFPHRKTEAI